MTRELGRFLRQNAIGLLALFVALGGTTFAASTLISGSQIRPHTIAKNRLTNRAISQLKGNRGPQGIQGPKGDKGDKGDPGPSAAFAVHRETISPPVLPANADTTVATLALPAGKYVINANVDMDEISGSKHIETCHLSAGGDTDRVFVTTDGTANGEEECALQVVHEFAAPGNVTLSIETQAGTQVRGGNAKITAIAVGALTNTSVTG